MKEIFTTDLIAEFNSLVLMINIDKYNINDNNRYDITYLNEITRKISELKKFYKIISNKEKTVEKFYIDLNTLIIKEQELLSKLIINLNTLRLNEKIGVKFYDEVIPLLRDREEKLLNIILNDKKQLRKFIKTNEDIEIFRLNLERIVKSAIILASTLKILIINIGIIRNSHIREVIDMIIDDMIYAINFFTFVINPKNSNNDDYAFSYDLQQKFYKEIESVMNATIYNTYFLKIKDFNSSKKIERKQKTLEEIQKNAVQERAKRAKLNISNILKFNDKNAEILKKIRKVFFTKKLKEDELKNHMLIRKRDIRFRVIVILEEINSTELTIPKIREKIEDVNILFNKDDFEEDDLFKLSFERSTNGITDANYKPFLDKVKDNFINQNKKIKDSSKFKLRENYKNLRLIFGTLFNTDEPLDADDKDDVDVIENYVGNSIISLFNRYINNEGDMKFNDFYYYMVVNYEVVKNEEGKFIKIRQDGVGPGLRRDFITSLTTELFEKKILITRDGTYKYFLNPEFEPDETMRYLLSNNYNIENEDEEENDDEDVFKRKFTKDFYKFLGNLILFILINDCGLEKKLSSYLIASLCSTTDFNDIDYVSFMVSDFPDEFVSLINLMKNPEYIKPSALTYNDQYLLNEIDNIDNDCDCDNNNYDKESEMLEKEINKEIIEKCKIYCLNRNYIIDYIKKTAKFMMTRTMLRKDIDISPHKNYREISRRGKVITSLFLSGIPIEIRKEFERNNFYPSVINSYIKTPDMNFEIVDKLIQNLMSYMQINSDFIREENLRRLTQLFIINVLSYKPEFHENEENFFNFITDLLKFWSASSIYKENEKYKIKIDSELSEEHLPQSHTCFFEIDFPNYTGTDEEIGMKLFRKIKIAVSNVERGVGLYGGMRKRIRKFK